MHDSREGTPSTQIEGPLSESGRPSDEERRTALAKMGLLAAYTAPALLALLTGTKAHAMSV